MNGRTAKQTAAFCGEGWSHSDGVFVGSGTFWSRKLLCIFRAARLPSSEKINKQVDNAA